MENHDFVTARFTNNDRTTVMARWMSKTEKDKNGEPIYRVENALADPDNPIYKKILEYVSEDLLHENTVNWARAQREGYDNMVEAIAVRNGDLTDFGDDTQLAEKIMEITDKDYDVDNEKLFKFKLSLFDSPKINNSKDRNKKAALRKAKSYREVIQAVLKF